MTPDDDEETALAEAARGDTPFLVLHDDLGHQHIICLEDERPRTIGRRREADIALPWDRHVSRLHAELRCLAGEWTVNDDGLSQNGTYVNEVRLVGRRRLFDGDEVRVGRTRLAFRDPTATATGLTLLPGELNSVTALSEQQQGILHELCRPLAQERTGERVRPASDREIGERLGLPVRTVANEVAALCGAFDFDALPEGTARKELANLALEMGLVSFEDD
jgi:pSer/pThr/pTyr-binding forkhead associated (FHA) protein